MPTIVDPIVPTAIERLKAIFVTACSGLCSTVRLGYVSELASGQTNYDACLLLPPDAVITEPRRGLWSSSDFSIRYFLMKLDVGASGGEMTETERTAAWGSLYEKNRDILKVLTADPSKYQLMSGVNVKLNSGGEDGILPDKVIWIEVTFTLKADDCE
jgi:hypothetical protein